MMVDVLIVGAGSAGAVLATRLSEDPTISVLLLEAGADHAERATIPPDLLDSRSLGAMTHDWGYTAEARPGRSIQYRRGRVVGGTSAINAAAALRPRPHDLAAWVEAGGARWSWSMLEPVLRRMERDLDFPAPPHGDCGPLPISRYRDEELIPFQRAFRDGCRAIGLPTIADHNLPDGRGVGPWPMNRDGLIRMSTLLAYLAPARGRPNLTIRPDSMVDRILIRNGCAAGVVLAGLHAGEELLAGQVVLAAGAIGTPAILLRSGIGPADDLEALGIPVLANRPGVGFRLWEHPAVHVRLVPPDGQCIPGRDPRFQMFARLPDPASLVVDDLALNAVTFVDVTGNPSLRARAGVDVVAVVAAALMRPAGHGSIRLASADPLDAPLITLDLAEHPDDLKRLAAATRRAWQVATAPAMEGLMRGVVGLTEAQIESDTNLADYVRANVATFNHPAGTAPMGQRDDPMSVVDTRLRVHGVPGLAIADASIMPSIPSAVINLSCIMIGEVMADLMYRAE